MCVLPLIQDGKRVHDAQFNLLTVIANDSYANYVRQLQTEVAEEFGGAASTPKPQNARERGVVRPNKEMMLTPEFRELWERIKHKTRYKVAVDTESLVAEVVAALDEASIELPQISIGRGRVVADEEDNFSVQHTGEGSFAYRVSGSANVVGYMEHRLAHTTPAMRLTRRTLLQILKRTRNQQAALDNPSEFAKVAVGFIREKITQQFIDGIKI